MRTCFRKVNAGLNIPGEVASISRKYDAAQRVFNGKPGGPQPANTVTGKLAHPSQMLVQNSFADIQRQLEETVSKLKTMRDPDRKERSFAR